MQTENFHCFFRLILDNVFYYINCGAIQEFPALRKAFTTHVKKYRIFSCVDIANQLLTRHYWRHSVRLMNERQILHDS